MLLNSLKSIYVEEKPSKNTNNPVCPGTRLSMKWTLHINKYPYIQALPVIRNGIINKYLFFSHTINAKLFLKKTNKQFK